MRVRSVQVHDTAVEKAEAGQRVAVNLPQLERRDLARGDVLVTPGHFVPSYRLDIRLAELAPVPAAVTVHLGTRAVPARLVRDGEYAQLRLASAVVAARGDRVVLRTDTTVAAASLSTPRRRAASTEHASRRSSVETRSAFVHAPVARATLRRLFSDDELEPLLSPGELVYSEAWLDDLRESVQARLAARATASPLDPGSPSRSSFPSTHGRWRCSTSSGTARRHTSPVRRRPSATVRRQPTRSKRGSPRRRS